MGYVYALSAACLWGFIGYFAIIVSDFGFSPYEVSFIRVLSAFTLGSIYLVGQKVKERKKSSVKVYKPFDRKKLIFIVSSGILCQALLNIFYSKAVVLVGSVTGIMLMATGPIFTILLCSIFFNESFDTKKCLSLILTIIGVIIMLTEGHISNINFNFLGVVFGLLSGVCYGIFPVINKKALNNYNPVEITIYSFGAAAIFLLPFLSSSFFNMFFQVEVIIYSLLYGLIPTLLAYMLYSKSMVYIEASTASIISLLEVPATAIVAYFLLGEVVSLSKAIGISIVIIGIVIPKLRFAQKLTLKKV